MERLDLTVADWPEIDGWRVAPAGCPFAVEGARLRIGNEARIGDGASIGDGARIGRYATIGNGARIGRYAGIGDGARIGRYAGIGDGARVGPRATDVIDLGHVDGYRKCLMQVAGVAWIGAGCRWFTLAQAVQHWSDHKEDRADTCDLMAAAVAMATRRGWKLDT